MTEVELRPMFIPFGEVLEIAVIKDRVTGLSRGCAFVSYKNKEAAQAAIDALHDKHTLPPATNPIQVKYAEVEKERAEHKLFVGMIPKTATEEHVREYFSPYGQVVEVHILTTPDGQSKGCCFVKYSASSEAAAAIDALNGQFMEGSANPLNVKYAETAHDKQKKMLMQQQTLLSAQQTMYQQALAAAFLYQQQMQQQGIPPADAQAYSQQYMQQALSQMGAMGGMGAMGAMGMGMGAMGQMGRAPMRSVPQQSEGPPGANLFIYHIPNEYSDQDLMATFSPFGNVISAHVFIDKNTGLSKGFGFVSYDNAASAAQAISMMNGFQVGTKRLKVQLKKQNTAKPY